ncbi:MAG: chemotaxis protein CheX [Desulfuromonadales bacterium C00003094]|nr:MAG: chemotaxis protein CheX [Desulfuromonadales bacterium C00003094]OEU77196.1 MAG: chemotaxis protein CheX [Desulfuromonadales bacterium C00003107]
MDLSKSISQATQEIFQTMLMMEASPGQAVTERPNGFVDSVSAIVGMAGANKGMLAIHIPASTALVITSSFLMMEVTEVDEDVKDAIGELANMVAGSIKADLTEQGQEFKLSIPSVVCGAEYEIDCLTDSDGVSMPFSIEGGEFLVEFHLQK